ncbi:ArsR/SmtB family transcription factor [Kribbella sp. NPDC051587]|uniref:ArsR/SmtB family transcription factor n=1 Tax=Kribbella sp. NPDC051587 TaxID=3364119 RepID=UPI0037A60046
MTDAFAALAHPVRRRLLELLVNGPRTAGDLAAQFELSRPAVAEHLKILRDAELVRDRAEGRERHYSLDGAPLAVVTEWLHPFEQYWRPRLRALADLAEELEGSDE